MSNKNSLKQIVNINASNFLFWSWVEVMAP
jgi:hypothetical protein